MTIDVATADAFHKARGNADWLNLSDLEKAAALLNAGDYRDAYYTFLPDADKDARYETGTYLLARLIYLNPPPVIPDAPIKSTHSEMAGMIDETVYFGAVEDPYPIVSAAFKPLLVTGAKGLFTIQLIR